MTLKIPFPTKNLHLKVCNKDISETTQECKACTVISIHLHYITKNINSKVEESRNTRERHQAHTQYRMFHANCPSLTKYIPSCILQQFVFFSNSEMDFAPLLYPTDSDLQTIVTSIPLATSVPSITCRHHLAENKEAYKWK